MFYSIKKKIISSNMAKKKRNNPFKMEESELFVLSGNEDLSFNNSYFFTAHNEKGDSIVVRLGLRNNLPDEVFFFLKYENILLVHPKDHYKKEESPVSVKCIEPGNKWSFTFNGKLKEYTSDILHDVKMEAIFIATLPIFDFFYDSSSKGMSEAIAREKWTKEYFEAIGHNDQRHYEQTGRLSGSFTIDSKESSFEMSCVRDHSFGTRNWDYMDDHIWVCGMNDRNEVINFSFVNYPNMKRVYLGYSNINHDKNIILDGYKLLDYDICDGNGPQNAKFRCHFENKSSIEMECEREANIPVYFGDGVYCFQEAIGKFIIDGEVYRGTIEYGFNRNPKRWNY